MVICVVSTDGMKSMASPGSSGREEQGAGLGWPDYTIAGGWEAKRRQNSERLPP